MLPPPSPPTARYAAVAVDTPVRPKPTGGVASTPAETFTYAIPDRLAQALAPGALVIVPFGQRRMQGVVIAFVPDPPAARAREIIEVVADEPPIAAADVALAEWMAAHYLAPLYACLSLFLPPQSGGRIETAYRRTHLAVADVRPEPPSEPHPDSATASALTLPLDLGPDSTLSPTLSPISAGALAALALFKAHQKVGEALLLRRGRAAGMAPATLHRALGELVRTGLVHAESPLAVKTPGPRLQTVVALTTTDRRALADRLEGLKAAGRRSPRYRALVDELLAADEPLAWPDLADRTGSSTAVRKVLEAAGILVSRRVPAGGSPSGSGDWSVSSEDQAPEDRDDSLSHAIGQPLAWVGTDRMDVLEARDAPERPSSPPLHGSHAQPLTLTTDQQAAWGVLEAELLPAVRSRKLPAPPFEAAPQVVLLRGVTGSGKTELYLQAIAACLAAGRQAIVLVPEIALTPQTVARFDRRFPGQVGVWHSAMATGERVQGWRQARAGRVGVVVGARSALFAPLPNLGLIVVDEEHADSYKQEEPAPRYDARVVAVERARRAGAAVLFGSATPSAEAHYHVRQGTWHEAVLARRIGAAALPPVQVVDMRQELKEGHRSIFSRALTRALGRILDRGEQAILFLNRRGSATFVLCRDCGHVLACPRCRMPLTWHGSTANGPGTGAPLVCHRCNYRTEQPMLCPECASPRIRYFGTGTQRVEDEVRQLFPAARLLRWDADTTTRRGAHAALLEHFASGRADVLVGTQMIAKGLDLPLVTLVGVILADTGLALPDLWAAERTFQLLTQVAGRAGRADKPGEVILQTYAPEHAAIQRAAKHDYDGFMDQELAFRQHQGYPPFRTLVKLVYRASSDAAAEKAADSLAAELRGLVDRLGLAGVTILGPAPAFFGRIRGRVRWQILVMASDPHHLLRHARIGPGWVVDVEPVTAL